MSKDAAYASATVSLLDRDSQTVQKMMMYPITRVELNEFTGSAVETRRVFVVADNGTWVEVS